MKILIIEDEINSAKELERILVKLDIQNEVTAILDSVKASIEYLQQHDSPDLIFSDIQLADGMCFEIYSEVTVNSPIIFCTAYDEYMLDAFETNAVGYLLKPITELMVEKALGKLKRLKSAFEPAILKRSIDRLSEKFKAAYKKSILVEQREKIIPISVHDIACLFLENTVIRIITLTSKQYFMASTLDELERMLDPESFYRANRQYIINRLSIANIERFFSRKLICRLTVETPETIVVSKANSSDFLRWLEGGTTKTR